MNKYIVFRMALALMSVGLMVFSLVPNLVSAQKPCQDTEGWTTIDGTQIDLSGTWNLSKSTDCKNGWYWTRNISITDDNGKYIATVGAEQPSMTVQLNSSGIVFERDLSWVGNGKDEKGESLQTWRGVVQKNDKGRIRIYGEWSGAYEYMATDAKYNLDFKMMKDE